MKIGIVTYHRTLNYGACLQAVATRIILTKLGHDVYYVDYWPDYHKAVYDLFSFKRFKILPFKKSVKYIIDTIRYYKSKKTRIGNFELFFNEYVYPFCKDDSEEFDVVVYGSDQIWRKQHALHDYNHYYFGDNTIKTKLHVAYSASMGLIPEDKAEGEHVKDLVSHLDKISVREKDLFEFLFDIGIENVKITLDPTLLLNKNDWNEIIPIKPYIGHKYVLIYSIGVPCFNLKEIEKYAKRRGYIVKRVLSDAIGKDNDLSIGTVNPIDFLNLIRHAECVFTSSFHGLAFSIIYEKEFFASFDKNPSRAKTLLHTLQIDERLINPYQNIPEVDSINYDLVSKFLNSERTYSINYLNSI